MHKKMDLVIRRITSSDTVSPEEAAAQERLHLTNVQTITIALNEGLPMKFISSSDEFGMLLFPRGLYKWEKSGAIQVKADIQEDKRQYTGDVVHNMAGEIIFVNQIFTGKTERALPSLSVRLKYPQFNFDVSENHWANHATKVRLIGHRLRLC